MTDSLTPIDKPAKKVAKPASPPADPGKKVPKKASKKGRVPPKNPRTNPNLLSFEDAREYIRSEMIESRVNFETWYQRVKPKTISRFPYRTYEKKGWISWNDFLGVNNKFIGKKVARWRLFPAAVVWAHTLRIETAAQWTEFARGPDKPADIPHRPDIVYSKWISWNHWLGNKPSERIKVAKENQGVFYIIHEEGHPSNVLTYGVEPSGVYGMKQRWDRAQYTIIKFFKHDREKIEEVTKVINALTTEYYGHSKQRITPNVWEVIWHMQMHLDIQSDLRVEHQAARPGLDGLVPIE